MTYRTQLPLDIRAGLVVLYSEPGRHYHNLAHIQHCIRELEEFAVSPEAQRLEKQNLINFVQLELAIWFHDAVYDPRSKSNEENSAELAGITIQRMNANSSAVRRLIHCTKHGTTVAGTVDEHVMLDIDLAILGRPAPEYREYSKNIRLEYDFVDADVYRTARSTILQSFLDRPFIYTTEYFRSKYETQARANIEEELALLQDEVNWPAPVFGEDPLRHLRR